MKVTVDTLKKCKQNNETFTCITAYDATFSSVINDTGIETILVGDSLGMVMQGHETTVPVTIEHIIYHTQCVSRANRDALIIADMPFMSHSDKPSAIKNATRLMHAGAHMVKMEGGDWMCDIITELVRGGIPVCAHIGLLPQTINATGSYKIQGRTEQQARQLLNDAKSLVSAGSQMILMECVVSSLAKLVDESIDVPTIGIGAGSSTTGQVLVLQDLLGLVEKAPRFSKNFMEGSSSIQEAIQKYHSAVKKPRIPFIRAQFHLIIMNIFTDIQSIQNHLSSLKASGQSYAFVPTMGHLHQGHLDLVELAKTLTDNIVVSIYVNPLQFGANEDLGSYPRTFDSDIEKLEALDVNCVFAPNDSIMYPDGKDKHTKVSVPELSDDHCGKSRPQFFWRYHDRRDKVI